MVISLQQNVSNIFIRKYRLYENKVTKKNKFIQYEKMLKHQMIYYYLFFF